MEFKKILACILFKLLQNCKFIILLLIILLLSLFIPSVEQNEKIFRILFIFSLIYLIFCFVSAAFAKDHWQDILNGQWIYRFNGCHSRSIVTRTVWIYIQILAIMIIYAFLDSNTAGDNGYSHLQQVCDADNESIFFVIDNCFRKINLLASILIFGFFGFIINFQQQFSSKFQQLHEMRESLMSKDPKKSLLYKFDPNNSLCDIRMNSWLYYAEHVLLFEMWNNSSFRKDLILIITRLKICNKGLESDLIEALLNSGYKRLAIAIKFQDDCFKDKVKVENKEHWLLCLHFKDAKEFLENKHDIR